MIGDILGIVNLARTFQKDRTELKTAKEQKDFILSHFSQAMVHELRVALNKIDLAKRAQEKQDFPTRNIMIVSIQVPLLEAVATGFYFFPSPELAADVCDTMEKQSSENANEDDSGVSDEKSEYDNFDIFNAASLFIARLECVKALASTGTEPMGINWNVRLDRFSRELLNFMKFMVSDK